MEKLSRMLGEYLLPDSWGLRPGVRKALVEAATGDPRVDNWEFDDHSIFFWVAQGYQYFDGGDRLSGFSAASVEEFRRKIDEVTPEEVTP